MYQERGHCRLAGHGIGKFAQRLYKTSQILLCHSLLRVGVQAVLCQCHYSYSCGVKICLQTYIFVIEMGRFLAVENEGGRLI